MNTAVMRRLPFLSNLVIVSLSESSTRADKRPITLWDGAVHEVAIVKVGGSSITDKARYETLNKTALAWFSRAIASHTSDYFRAPEVKNPSFSCYADSVESSCSSFQQAFIVVHGAGSFGHHKAKEFGLQGYSVTTSGARNGNGTDSRERRRRMQGLTQTRHSVLRLNSIVVQSLIDQGINAVAVSPCFGVIPYLRPTETDLESLLVKELLRTVELTLRAGIVPVLHGDACLCSSRDNDVDEMDPIILSGDTLLEWLGSAPWISRAIFLSDVNGVYTRDPKADPSARLLRELEVTRDGNGGLLVTPANADRVEASGSEHDHDVTGGLKVRRFDGVCFKAPKTRTYEYLTHSKMIVRRQSCRQPQPSQLVALTLRL
jgi:isopentenyl phosphate kinase